MRKVLIAIVASLFLSCEYNDVPTCYHGTVLGFNCCSGTTLVSLNVHVANSYNKIKIGETEYSNVIAVPGDFASTSAHDVFVTIRPYDSQKDSDIPNGMCLCVMASGYQPTHVITGSSSSECP